MWSLSKVWTLESYYEYMETLISLESEVEQMETCKVFFLNITLSNVQGCNGCSSLLLILWATPAQTLLYMGVEYGSNETSRFIDSVLADSWMNKAESGVFLRNVWMIFSYSAEELHVSWTRTVILFGSC